MKIINVSTAGTRTNLKQKSRNLEDKRSRVKKENEYATPEYTRARVWSGRRNTTRGRIRKLDMKKGKGCEPALINEGCDRTCLNYHDADERKKKKQAVEIGAREHLRTFKSGSQTTDIREVIKRNESKIKTKTHRHKE